jgi:hypothetical protein
MSRLEIQDAHDFVINPRVPARSQMLPDVHFHFVKVVHQRAASLDGISRDGRIRNVRVDRMLIRT